MKIADLHRNPFYRLCWRWLFLLGLAIVACKLTKGAFGGVIVLAGVWGALTRKPAYALICFALLPFMTIMNPITFGFGGMLGISARIGMPIMTMAMLVAAAQRPGRNALPILSLLAYAVVAFVSSINGYAPMISNFKLINFVLFILGIYVGTKNIDRNARDLVTLRAFFFAFSVFIVVGSIALNYINPYAAHFSTTGFAGSSAEGNAAIAARVAATGDAGFLCGVVNHSQCLGPTAACVFGWVLMDMLFVEKRFAIGHVIVLACCPIVMYWTKSRTSLLAFLIEAGIISTYCVPKFRVSPQLKRRLRSMMTSGVVLLLLAGAGLEASSGGMRKWVLKHGDTTDKITMENVTASRQGLIEEGLYDFRQNPLWGKGFQVSSEHQYLNTEGRLILSAPIEKGFIPTMILGETGAMGAIVFSLFLMMFYTICGTRRYYATMALFTGYLATNLGEATFFSPGGTGGPEWLFALAGGFVIDMMTVVQKRQNLV